MFLLTNHVWGGATRQVWEPTAGGCLFMTGRTSHEAQGNRRLLACSRKGISRLHRNHPPYLQCPEAEDLAARCLRLLALQQELAQLKRTPSMQLLARQRIRAWRRRSSS